MAIINGKVLLRWVKAWQLTSISKSKIPIYVRGTEGGGRRSDRTLKVKKITMFHHKPCPKPMPCAAVLGSNICICTKLIIFF